MIQLTTTQKYILAGAAVAVMLPPLLQTSAATATVTLVRACAKEMFQAMAAPTIANSSIGLKSYAIWAMTGAGAGFGAKIFADSHTRERVIIAMVLTAVVSTYVVSIVLSETAALTTFFTLGILCYAFFDDLKMSGYFSFSPQEAEVSIEELPGLEGYMNKLLEREKQCWQGAYQHAWAELKSSVGPKSLGEADIKSLMRGEPIVLEGDEQKVTQLLDKARRCQKGQHFVLAGPPGTGKSQFAEAYAESLNRPIIRITAKDLIGGDIVKIGARLANLARQAVSKRAVIILDEADAFLKSREHMSNVQLDIASTAFMGWIETIGKKINIICTTNYPDKIDTAAVRAGRFDQIIEIKLPNLEQRKAIFSHYTYREIGNSLDDCEEWSGADIKLFAKLLSQGEATDAAKAQVNTLKRAQPQQVPHVEVVVDDESGAADHRAKIQQLIRQIMQYNGFAIEDFVAEINAATV